MAKASKRYTDKERSIGVQQWVEITKTLTHFNSMIHGTRQVTATIVLAAFGAALAAFTANPSLNVKVACLPQFHISISLICLGLVSLLVGLFIDRFYYFKLLVAGVNTATELENRFDLPAKLTKNLSAAVSVRRATLIVRLFYLAGLAMGALIAFLLSIVEIVPKS